MTEPDFHLVRLTKSGDTIHKSTCRYAQKRNAARWVWADRHPDVDWFAYGTGLKRCQVCMPPSPFKDPA